MFIYLYQSIDSQVSCACVFLCDIKREYLQKPCHLCKTFSAINSLLHEIHNKVQRVQSLWHIGISERWTTNAEP